MAVGDGVTWNEALPDNTTLASEIDDYDRDLRVGMRSRMALEHVWPSAHTGTGSGGRHTYITFQPQAAAPTMAGTTGGGLYVTTEVSPRLIFTRSNASDVTIVNTAGAIPIITTGTQGSLVIASSAASYGVTLLVASADGLYLKTHSTTAAPSWGAVTSLDASVIVAGSLSGARLTSYDSGWVAVSTAANVTFTHNLNTTTVLCNLWFSQNSNGASPFGGNMAGDANGAVAAQLISLTSTQVTLKTTTPTSYVYYEEGTPRSSGYVRLIMIALA